MKVELMKRRQFIRNSTIGFSGLLLPAFAYSQSAQIELNPLKIPELLEGTASEGVRVYDLEVRHGVSRFLPGISTSTLGINGDYLGPTLKLREGDQVSIRVNNTLSEETTLHWHGLHVPARADGGPHQIIAPGTTWQANFDVAQQAGTFWYHSHLMAKTGEQVYRGLAGVLLIDDAHSSNLKIPSNYGVDDIPLIVQDRMFDQDGSLAYGGNMMDTMLGMFGNTILVNGTYNPFFVPTTKKVRLRLLNASNARTYTFAFSDGRVMQQLACDGGFLAGPVEMHKLELAPAERCEVVVDFSDGQPVDLISLPMAADSPFMPRGMMRNMHPINQESFRILSFHPQSNLENTPQLPATLATVYGFDPANADRLRRFTLSMPMGMGMMGRRNGRGGMGMDAGFAINGAAMVADVINERIPVGSTEIWEIVNDSMMMHPFHIHHGQFRVISYDGQNTPHHELGNKDTVKVGPGQTVRVLMDFNDFVDPEVPYMYHCHILEHEDAGMMGQFVVE
jgi:blue copper oxidase